MGEAVNSATVSEFDVCKSTARLRLLLIKRTIKVYQTLLVVDDSKVSRMMTKKIVTQINPDALFVEAAGGEEALSALGANVVDAAVIDFHMPGMDGLELVEKVKTLQPDLPVVLLTANIQKEIKERAEKLGAGYLTKPAKLEDLEAFMAG